MKKAALVVLILLGLAAFVASEIFLGSVERRLSVSSLTESGRGLSLFHQLAAERGAKRITSAFLRAGSLQDVDTLVVTSPLIAFSEHEAKIVTEFVLDGGTLVLSFHDEATLTRLGPLLEGFGRHAGAEAQPNKAFVNGQTEAVSAEGLSLAAYSRLTLADDACKTERSHCFLRDWQEGDGRIVLMAGIPLFSNALLPLGDNAAWSAKLLSGGGRFAFDEYHHYFSEKTVADLAAEPNFIVPLAGLLVLILLFLAFGDAALRERPAASEQPQLSRSYQDLNTSFLRGALASAAAANASLAKMADLLRRRYPNESIELPARDQAAGEAAAALLAAHKRILVNKGHSANS